MHSKLVIFLLLSFVSSGFSDIINAINSRKFKSKDYELAVRDLISRVIGSNHDVDDFVVSIDENLNPKDNLDTFELETIQNNSKLKITATSAVAAAWGFNYYLKYYCNSSIQWSGKNINIGPDSLPVVPNKVRITSKDYIRFYQNVCTYSYSYVWWDWDRWEFEIDWMALNGVNLVYAQTGAEYPWIKVLSDMGFTRKEIDDFFAGPAYLAWFRMGNLKNFGGPLTDSWHQDQVKLQKMILKRYNELGINYILPAFAGFVPDQIQRLYPDHNFTKASDWIGFNCNFSCTLMVDPFDPLFMEIGQAYNREVINSFGPSSFYSADVFNEMIPKSQDLTYLAKVNEAVYKTITSIDKDAIWVMQAWVFNDMFWLKDRVKAFLSRIPIGKLIILDLYSETMPHFQQYDSFFGQYFIWNMLLDFGGANGLFGKIDVINTAPDMARSYPNSSMIGIGITPEGINQNELMYEFMMEKAWNPTFNDDQLRDWLENFSIRRYSHFQSPPVGNKFRNVWKNITKVLYDTNDYQNKQLFTKRPCFDLEPEKVVDLESFFSAWDIFVSMADDYKSSSLFIYDLVDLSKEALRYFFELRYLDLKESYSNQDLYQFNAVSSDLLDILNDMEILLNSDSRFLLSSWISDARGKGTNMKERNLYEQNARSQITLWGKNTTSIVFDYACKAWSGLVEDYYLPRWQLFFRAAEKSLIEGTPFDVAEFNQNVLINVELPFVSSKKTKTGPTGHTVDIVKSLNQKYRH